MEIPNQDDVYTWDSYASQRMHNLN
jgi:hypothetical protein